MINRVKYIGPNMKAVNISYGDVLDVLYEDEVEVCVDPTGMKSVWLPRTLFVPFDDVTDFLSELARENKQLRNMIDHLMCEYTGSCYIVAEIGEEDQVGLPSAFLVSKPFEVTPMAKYKRVDE